MVREAEGEDIEALRLVFTAEDNHISERQSGTLMDDGSKTTRANSRATNAVQPTSARLAFGSEMALVGAENAGTSRKKRVQCMGRTYPQGC